MKQTKPEIVEHIRYVAENTGWSGGSSWFPIYELSYDTEKEARDAIDRHKKSFHGKIQYRLIKVTTTKEFLKLK